MARDKFPESQGLLNDCPSDLSPVNNSDSEQRHMFGSRVSQNLLAYLKTWTGMNEREWDGRFHCFGMALLQ